MDREGHRKEAEAEVGAHLQQEGQEGGNADRKCISKDAGDATGASEG
jgi:hypothetical protein